jgi:hypothetical protein
MRIVLLGTRYSVSPITSRLRLGREQLRNQLPAGWRATLRALEGIVSGSVERQLDLLPREARPLASAEVLVP